LSLEADAGVGGAEARVAVLPFHHFKEEAALIAGGVQMEENPSFWVLVVKDVERFQTLQQRDGQGIPGGEVAVVGARDA
jgi:hypothetical protein